MKPNFISLSKKGAITSEMTKQKEAEESNSTGPGGGLADCSLQRSLFMFYLNIYPIPCLKPWGFSPHCLGPRVASSTYFLFACCDPLLHFSLFPFPQLSSLHFSSTPTGSSSGPASKKKMDIPTNSPLSSPHLHCHWGRILNKLAKNKRNREEKRRLETVWTENRQWLLPHLLDLIVTFPLESCCTVLTIHQGWV